MTGLPAFLQRSGMETLEGQFISRVSTFSRALRPEPDGVRQEGAGRPEPDAPDRPWPVAVAEDGDRILAFIAAHDGASGGGRDPPRRP